MLLTTTAPTRAKRSRNKLVTEPQHRENCVLQWRRTLSILLLGVLLVALLLLYLWEPKPPQVVPIQRTAFDEVVFTDGSNSHVDYKGTDSSPRLSGLVSRLRLPNAVTRLSEGPRNFLSTLSLGPPTRLPQSQYDSDFCQHGHLLPQVFLLGVQKCGTSSLFQHLVHQLSPAHVLAGAHRVDSTEPSWINKVGRRADGHSGPIDQGGSRACIC